MSFWAPFFSNQSMLGAIFAHIFREFVKVFRDFAWFLGILPGFSPNQHCWGGLHSRLVHQCHTKTGPRKFRDTITPPGPRTTSGLLSHGFSQQSLPHQSFVEHSGYICRTDVVVFSQLGEVVRHSGLCEFHSCTLCHEVSHQGRNKGGTMPRAPNHLGGKVASLFFNAVHLLPKHLRLKYGSPKLVPCHGRIPWYAPL